jgi:NADH-quinone oxidoreductase subunit I
MRAMARLIKTLKGLWSLVIGLKITGVEFCRPWLTVHYPWLEVKNLSSFRGHIELVGTDGDPKTPRCIMCRKCVEICPSRCISLQMHVLGEAAGRAGGDEGLFLAPGIKAPGSVHKDPPPDRIERVLDDFHLNYSLCSLCGLCVQICPVEAIRFSRDAYLVSTERQALDLDLLERLRSPAVPAAPSGRDSSVGIYKAAELVKVPDLVRVAGKLNPRHLPPHEVSTLRSRATAEDGSSRQAKS